MRATSLKLPTYLLSSFTSTAADCCFPAGVFGYFYAALIGRSSYFPMSYPVSALSPAPFGQQLQRRHCSVQLWPDFKPASTQSSNSNLSPKNTQTQSPRTALDYAFSAAYQALSGGVTTQLRVPPTSTAPFSSDRSNDVNPEKDVGAAIQYADSMTGNRANP